ncbi:hypothetical protein Tco_1233258, partial [Tanacetum coccineum]
LEDWNDAMLTKHLWNIAYKKDTFWSWKCLLEIRDKVMDKMQYEVGDGSKICMWYDRWHDSGLLINLMTHRELSNARMSKMIKLADMIHEDAWKWPNSWIIDELDVISTVIPRLRNEVSDKVKWRSVDNSLVPFHTKEVMKVFSPQMEKVKWYKLEWFNQCIPKHAFCLWLAMLGRL